MSLISHFEDKGDVIPVVHSQPLDEVTAVKVHSFFQDVIDGKIDPSLPADYDAEDAYDEQEEEASDMEDGATEF